MTIDLAPGEKVVCTFSNARRGADALIAKQSAAGPYRGDDIFSATPLRSQTQRRNRVARGAVVNYWARVQNDGKRVDSFTIDGDATGSPAIEVAYFVDGLNVTGQVDDGTYTIANLAPGAYVTVLAQVTVSPSAGANAKKTVVVAAASVGKPAVVDLVRAITQR